MLPLARTARSTATCETVSPERAGASGVPAASSSSTTMYWPGMDRDPATTWTPASSLATAVAARPTKARTSRLFFMYDLLDLSAGDAEGAGGPEGGPRPHHVTSTRLGKKGR